MKKLFKQRTFWTAIGTIFAAVAGWLMTPEAQRIPAGFVALGLIANALGTIFAREGGVNAALELSGFTPLLPETVTQVEAIQYEKGVGLAGQVLAVVAAAEDKPLLLRE